MLTQSKCAEVIIADCEDFEPRHIFECGQCFRFNASDDGVYRGVAFGRAVELRRDDGGVRILCEDGDFEAVWKDYFDLSRDYAAARAELCREPRLRDAVAFGKGIRILRQEPWEALCSFIISQCNNIPRIKGIIESLSSLCGEKIQFNGATYSAFPDASRVAELSERELASLRAGYRTAYLSAAARLVASGALDLEAIRELPTDKAKERLLELPGVGEKVASCVLLFGFGKLDAFPVDVWMKRAITAFFGSGFDYRTFGSLAGLAQQYMFYYMRSGK